MTRAGVLGLDDLIAEAHGRCPSREAFRDWFNAHVRPWDGEEEEFLRLAWHPFEEIHFAAERGDYHSAGKAADVFLKEWAVGLAPGNSTPFLAWSALSEACDLASRIDSFLAALSREKVAGALARDCRKDLSLLLVLADWSAENGRPAIAAEARHLYGLVRYRRR